MAAGGIVCKIKCFVFFDAETTGLPSAGNNPRITELCFLALTRDELTVESSWPRAMNKLNLCFNPQKMISPPSTRLTGLHNDSLEHLATFKTQASLICEFLRNLPHPVCLVAHNGNKFDFPLLVAHLKKSAQSIPGDVLCADSLEAFKTFDGHHEPKCVHTDFWEKNRKDQTSSDGGPSMLNNPNKTQPGSCAAPMSKTLDPKVIENVSSGPRKRGLDDCFSGNGVLNDEIDNYFATDLKIRTWTVWNTNQPTTPSKKTLRIEPPAPTKKQLSHRDGTALKVNWTGVRQNLFGSEETSQNDECESQNTADASQMPKFASSKCSHKQVLNDTFVKSQKEDVLNAMDCFHSLQENESLSTIPPLSDNEEFLLKAVEEVEKTESLKKKCVIGGEAEIALELVHTGNGKIKTTNVCKTNKNTPNSSSLLCTTNKSLVVTPRTVSYSLPKIYARVFGQQPLVSHTAEDDCFTMLKIIRGCATDKFPRWCDENAILLSSVPPMF